MKLQIPHHTSISHMLQKLAQRRLLKASLAVAKLHKIELFRSVVLLASSRRAVNRSSRKLEYQFSASSTPLIHQYYYRKNGKQQSSRRFCAFLCPCVHINVQNSRWDDEDSGGEWGLEAVPTTMMLPGREESEDGAVREAGRLSNGGEYDDSVDEKAERFIARFYEEMRKQRRESIAAQNCEVAAFKF